MYDQVSSSMPAASSQPSMDFRRMFSVMLWLVVGSVLIGYGLLAFDSGTKISPTLNPSSDGGAAIERILSEAELGPVVSNTKEIDQFVPTWINLIADIESDQYAYGRDSVLPIEHHYLSMPESERHVLSTHMLLGLVIMGAGFLQFWPAFRRKYRTAHRLFGVLYVGAGFTSMAMSGYYLVVTDIADIYSTFVFYVGLWVMLIFSVLGLSMAGYSIIKKDIARHLGWQAVAFGFFLTAPTQRIYWILLSPFSEGATFNEMNIVVNVMLFAQASLFGYLLFLINRGSSPLKRKAPISSSTVGANNNNQFAARVLTVAGFGVLAWFYLFASGMESTDAIMHIVPSSAAAAHDQLLVSPSTYLLVSSLTVVFGYGLKLLFTPSISETDPASTKLQSLFIGTSGTIAAITLCFWGYELGLPSHAKSVAGVFYMSTGLLLLPFIAGFMVSVWKQKEGYMKEFLLFVVMLALAPVFQILLLHITGVLNTIPEIYRLEGHGYQIAAGFALFLGIIAPFATAIYSSHTNRYAVN